MVLEARWEGIHQKVDIAGRVEILAADCHRGRSRDTVGPDFREASVRNCLKDLRCAYNVVLTGNRMSTFRRILAFV